MATADQQTPRSKVRVGDFISTSKPYQIGKAERSFAGNLELTLFHSISEPEEAHTPHSKCIRATLAPQTRVYYRQDGDWLLGTVVGDPQPHPRTQRRLYHVFLPALGESQWLSERHLYVRCIGADGDPIEVLQGVAGLESRELHTLRLGAVTAFTQLRAASQGLTGLLSSAVDLVPHQMEVVRRVLQDPIQRYLLADEVGLGKTIEAGAIIRQFLLDVPRGTVTVLAPAELVRQWEEELTEKFGIADFPTQVAILPFDQVGKAQPDAAQLLVVDEAHHLVTDAGFDNPDYCMLAALAHRSQRVILLSATPVLGNEQAMLALLHLLDPSVYRPDDLAGFVERVARRQEYGSIVGILRGDAAAVRRRRHANELRELFPTDAVIANCLPTYVECDDEAQREWAARTLRRHIADTYRLHTRLIRTRRRELPPGTLPERQGQITVRTVAGDKRIARLCEVLEDWRERAAQASADSPALQAVLVRRYATLFTALGLDLEEFGHALHSQLVAASDATTFTDDAPLLRQLLNLLNSYEIPAYHRAQARVMRGESLGSQKTVAFTSSTELAYALFREMDRLQPESGAYGVRQDNALFLLAEGTGRAEIDATLERFRTSSKRAILVSDRSAEEGLNLHFADRLIHLDLPLAVARLEQRIGRLDRYGRRWPDIRHVVFLPNDAPDLPWQAWLELLRDGFGLFSRSLSEVQFLLPSLEPLVEQTLFQRGADGLRSLIPEIQQRLVEERQRLDEQYALDKLEADDGDALRMENLRDADDATDFAGHLERWWSAALQLERYADAKRQDVFWLRWRPSTRVPSVPWREHFKSGLSTPLSFRRAAAVRQPDVRLVRPGFPMVEEQLSYLDWDDGGTAFATWRRVPSACLELRTPWRGFQLSFLVESDVRRVPAIVQNLQESDELATDILELLPTLRRRADAILAPRVYTLFVGADDLRVVENPVYLDILRPDWIPPSTRHADHDFDLGRRPATLASAIDLDEFRALCADVRVHAERILRDDLSFQSLTTAAANSAELLIRDQNERLERRQAAELAEFGRFDQSLQRLRALNVALLECIVRPRVHLDSVGFIILSNDLPPSTVMGAAR